MKRSIAVALWLAATTTFGLAQTPAEHDQHHPQGAPPAQPPQAQSASRGAPGMMGMMRDMPMMHMMRRNGMMGQGASGMAMIARIEGRIAFLRAELGITEAQAGPWNAFADALRANARRLAEVSAAASAQRAGTLVQRLDAQEQWLAARLEGTRALKAAFAPLWSALSEEQKKSADELVAPHLGMTMTAMMPGAMARMPAGPMQPGGMMPGPMMMQGPMQPGQMHPMMPGQVVPSR